jgi:hypothetical protein
MVYPVSNMPSSSSQDTVVLRLGWFIYCVSFSVDLHTVGRSLGVWFWESLILSNCSLFGTQIEVFKFLVYKSMKNILLPLSPICVVGFLTVIYFHRFVLCCLQCTVFAVSRLYKNFMSIQIVCTFFGMLYIKRQHENLYLFMSLNSSCSSLWTSM